MKGLPGPDTTLNHYPWVVIRFRCHYCDRHGDARLARCAAKFGDRITLGDLLGIFIAGCAWNPGNPMRKPQKYGMKCGAYCPDIGRAGPPDHPPSMSGLTVIDGGRSEMLPAEPPRREWRRRVGED